MLQSLSRLISTIKISKIKSIIVTPQNGSGENAGTKKAFQARHMSQEKNADTPKQNANTSAIINNTAKNISIDSISSPF